MINNLGQKGENQAAALLRSKGYKIIAQNWRYSHYEIDIIAFHEDTLVIVEVKTRESDLFGHPSQFVNSKKHQNLYRAVEEYIEQTNYRGEIRFDIVAVFKKREEWITDHITDAFYPG